jgi:protoporphyrinogen oxidase
MHVGIIGGGMMGLATAFYLNKRGIQVTILEKEKEIGGLSRAADIMPGIRWDRFYHVILSNDNALLDFIDEIGLTLDVRFKQTNTGFYANGKLYSMSSTMEFLKFKPLSMVDKFRLGAGIFYVSKINNWKPLEKLYVKAWLTKVFGRRNYEKMWDPLLRSKLGAAREQTSAAFIWSTIKRYYGTRQSSSKKEMMGCVSGGYHSILNSIKDHLAEHGTGISTNCRIEKIHKLDAKRPKVYFHDGSSKDFDRVVVTIPNPEILRIMPDLAEGYRSQLEAVRYLGVICVTLVLNRSLTPFYVTNLTDPNLPFTGLIEATHVIPPEVLKGKKLIYLPKYLPPGDPFGETSDIRVIELFLNALKGMFPHLSEKDIVAHGIRREPYVQPLLDIGYSDKIPPMQTPIKNVFMVNTSMILNSTLNNNEVIKLAKRAADLVARDK